MNYEMAVSNIIFMAAGWGFGYFTAKYISEIKARNIKEKG